MNNLRTMSESDISKLYVAKVNKVQVSCNRAPRNENHDKSSIPFDYQKLKEISALDKPQAGRHLTCLVLAKSFDNQFLPFDPFEAKHFYEENFKCSEEEALEKYCRMRKENKDELLSYYKSIAETNRQKFFFPTTNQQKNKASISDILASTFFHLTR